MVGVDKHESEKWYWHVRSQRPSFCYGKEFGFIQRTGRSHWKVELVAALK